MHAYYCAPIHEFQETSPQHIVGTIAIASHFSDEDAQKSAWLRQVQVLQSVLATYSRRGKVFFEFAVPRLGKRIDVVVLLDEVVFVLEFKVGESRLTAQAMDQVWDYALDLKNFHETSRLRHIVPVLVATEAPTQYFALRESGVRDGVIEPVGVGAAQLSQVFEQGLMLAPAVRSVLEPWENGRYHPTPTIVEAAKALYSSHQVADIIRADADAANLHRTTEAISRVIASAKQGSTKAICFVTGVPGAGKTLVGLNIATRYAEAGQLHSVFLSGNGPLVSVLREALARDRLKREAERGKKLTKKAAMSPVQAFIQNVHHFRDAYLNDLRPPSDHIAVFDEAQRAWTKEKTADFMRRKRGHADFHMSEPEYLVSCLDRHPDWAVVVCLVGGGQEINSGEGGIAEWVHAIQTGFPKWEVHISPQLTDAEYGSGAALKALEGRSNVTLSPDLHLAVSMRSFRAEQTSAFVKSALDVDVATARGHMDALRERFPIVLTRDVAKAKEWVRSLARASERYGVIASSQAQRLKPHAVDVRSPIDPVHWFLHDKSDVRSSYYLEDVATEFHVQGLELDWACIVWDADLRFLQGGWQHYSFAGSKWNRINAPERRNYLKNAYRVLLTRARQGMVIVVPEGEAADHTRLPSFYDGTFAYLRELGIPLLA